MTILAMMGGIITSLIQADTQRKVANLNAATTIQKGKLDNATGMAQQANQLQQKASEFNVGTKGQAVDRRLMAREGLQNIFAQAQQMSMRR